MKALGSVRRLALATANLDGATPGGAAAAGGGSSPREERSKTRSRVIRRRNPGSDALRRRRSSPPNHPRGRQHSGAVSLEAVRRSSSARAPPPRLHRILGRCAFFQNRREKADARLGWLTRPKKSSARPSTRRRTTGTQINFELTTRLSAELRKQPLTPPKQLMQLLRPPTPGAKTPRRIG